MSFFRKSRVIHVEVVPEKKRRFSLFKSRHQVLAPDPILVIASDAPSQRDSLSSSQTHPEIERERALLALEGRVPDRPARSSRSSSVRRSDSMRSSASTCDEMRSASQVSSLLGLVPEDTVASPQLETNEDGLPTYASAAYPSRPTTYSFAQCSPFSMVISDDSAGMQGRAVYHLSVGVNVWMPSCTITTIRRGATEEGPVVAQLELGIMSGPATVTIGDKSRPLNQVLFKKTSSSSSRQYVLGNGNIIKWKMGNQRWQAYFGSTLLASFIFDPPRHLTLQPAAHRFSDHIVIALVILMREHLTPRAGMVGEAAQLFNYSPHAGIIEDAFLG